jgi:peptidyl-prolyl cis-trans isomerase SurA
VTRVRRLLAPAVGLAALTLTVSGCSIPAWVPLIGEDKPLPAGKPPAAEASPPAALAGATLLAAGHERLPDAADVLDRVICVVNNDAITLYELQEAEAHYLHENKERAPDGEARKALRERLLSHIIESRIQLQQAERDKVTVEDAEVSEQLEEIMKKLNAKTQPEFEEMLKGQGLTLEAVKKRIKDQIMVQRLTRRKVGLRVSVTEQEIDKYLEENREKLEVGLAFEARHILFLPEAGKGEEGWEAARQRAVHVYALLLEGQDFGELAKKYSEDASGKDGGSLGSLKRGELAPDIEAVVLKLDAGQVSPPFRSQVGYHLFRLDSKESLAGEALVQARNQIRDILYRQKYDARLQEWLAEMKQRAIIDIRM